MKFTISLMRNLLIFVSLSVLSGLFVAFVTKGPKTVYTHDKKNMLSEDEWVKQELAKLSVKERIAQSFLVACWCNKRSGHQK